MKTNCLYLQNWEASLLLQNPMFILPWDHEKFMVKFTMSLVGRCIIYVYVAVCVEIEGYSVTYFSRIAVFEAPYR